MGDANVGMFTYIEVTLIQLVTSTNLFDALRLSIVASVLFRSNREERTIIVHQIRSFIIK